MGWNYVQHVSVIRMFWCFCGPLLFLRPKHLRFPCTVYADDITLVARLAFVHLRWENSGHQNHTLTSFSRFIHMNVIYSILNQQIFFFLDLKTWNICFLISQFLDPAGRFLSPTHQESKVFARLMLGFTSEVKVRVDIATISELRPQEPESGSKGWRFGLCEQEEEVHRTRRLCVCRETSEPRRHWKRFNEVTLECSDKQKRVGLCRGDSEVQRETAVGRLWASAELGFTFIKEGLTKVCSWLLFSHSTHFWLLSRSFYSKE